MAISPPGGNQIGAAAATATAEYATAATTATAIEAATPTASTFVTDFSGETIPAEPYFAGFAIPVTANSSFAAPCSAFCTTSARTVASKGCAAVLAGITPFAADA